MDQEAQERRVGAVRRLDFLELDPQLQAALEPRVRRLGYLGEFFAVAGHQPAALLAFHEFTEALKRALPPELTEVIALTVATELENDYERCQHERLSVKLGFGHPWVAAAEGRAGSDPAALSETERCARTLALSVLADAGHEAIESVDEAVHRLGEERAVALLLLVGRFVAHGLVSNSVRLAAPVASIFAEWQQTEPGAGIRGRTA